MPLQSQFSQQFHHQALSAQSSSGNQQSSTPKKQNSQINLKVENNCNYLQELKQDDDFDENENNSKLKINQVQKSKSFNESAFNKININKINPKIKNDERMSTGNTTKLIQEQDTVDYNIRRFYFFV